MSGDERRELRRAYEVAKTLERAYSETYYPVKAMGKMSGGFEPTIVAIIEKHKGKIAPEDVRSKSSGAGNFQSVTVTIEVTSRAELEVIYQDLSACEYVLWTL